MSDVALITTKGVFFFFFGQFRKGVRTGYIRRDLKGTSERKNGQGRYPRSG